MDVVIKNVEQVFDGFFYFFGLTQNPAEEKAIGTLKDAPDKKIKSDIKKVNADFRLKLKELREEVSSIEW